MKFLNRRDAGRRLADILLREHIGNDRAEPRERTGGASDNTTPQLLVLGIPRGGIVVADEIARALDAPLDVLITRKIGAPFNAELALGAVTSDGTVFLDMGLIQQLHIPQRLIEHERDRQLREIQRRMQIYRRGRLPLVVKNRIVILADDGIATGATVIAALRGLHTGNPRRVILAVPVAPRQVVPQLRAECDELVILDTPEPFEAVGYFYEDFEQVTDETVIRILERSKRA